MNKAIKVSVIIPAYNVEEWLARCLDSVLVQTYTDLEIIVINDGSSDGTAKILDEYAARDARIVAVHQANAGLVATRENGIALATGDYVGFIDGDDTVTPDMYERLVRNAVTYQADISQCGIMYCFYDGRRKPMHGTNQIKEYNTVDGVRALLKGSEMEPSLCNKIYKKALLPDSCLDMSVVNNEDLLRNFVLFGRAQRSVFEDFCGYEYWRRSESMSNTVNQLKTSRHILRARKLIWDNADETVSSVACTSYVLALVTSYNAMIGMKDEESKVFRAQCKDSLRELENNMTAVASGTRKRAKAILHFSLVYDLFYRLHRCYIRFKIKQAQKRVRGSET